LIVARWQKAFPQQEGPFFARIERVSPPSFWTRHLKINVIFPKSRPPQCATLVEGNRQRGYNLGKGAQMLLPDGRWLVTWETRKPRLYENYILQWEW